MQKKKVYSLTLLINCNIYREASLGRLSGYLPAPGPTNELTFVISLSEIISLIAHSILVTIYFLY